jgi:hypothetical protein
VLSTPLRRTLRRTPLGAAAMNAQSSQSRMRLLLALLALVFSSCVVFAQPDGWFAACMNEDCLESDLAQQMGDVFCCPTTDEEPVTSLLSNALAAETCREPQACPHGPQWLGWAHDTRDHTLCGGNHTFAVEVVAMPAWVRELSLRAGPNSTTRWSTHLVSPNGADSCGGRQACCFNDEISFAFTPLGRPLLLLKPGRWLFALAGSGTECANFSLRVQHPPAAWQLAECSCWSSEQAPVCMAEGVPVADDLCSNRWQSAPEGCECPTLSRTARAGIMVVVICATLLVFVARIWWDIHGWRTSTEPTWRTFRASLCTGC